MKKLSYIILPFIVLGTSIFSSCQREEFEYISGPGEIITTGNIEVAPQVDQTGWKIISGLNEGTVANSKYNLKLNENTVQLISVVNADDQPILMSIDITGSQPSGNIISAATTAEALVFLFPFFCTSDLAEAIDLKQMINSAAYFDILVNTVGLRLEGGSFTLSETDSELMSALGNVVNEIMSTVESGMVNNTKNENNKGFLPVPDTEVNGLKIVELEQSNSELSIKISNRKKRWISVYVDKSSDGTTFARSDQYIDLIPSPKLSIWNIWKMQNIEFLPPENSDQININTSGYEAFEVKCYGLGVHNLIESLDDKEINRTLEPAFYSTVFDIGIPIVEVAIGMHINREIRGAPANDPRLMLVQKTFEDYGNDAILVARTLAWYREGDIGKLLWEVTKFMLKSCIDNPSLVSQIIFNELNANVARATLNTVFLVFRISNLVFKSVNIIYSLAAVLSTEAVTDFAIINSLSPMSVIVKGTVKNYMTSSPVFGASVSLYDESGNLKQITQTDATGSYTLGSNTGNPKIRVVAHGYKPSNQVLTVPQDIANQNPPIYYAPTTWLSVYSSETGDVGGIVVDATNLNPISGVTIELKPGENDSSREITQQVISESDGSFNFTSIPSGTYTAYFSKTGFINDFLVLSVLGGESTSGFIMNLSPNIHTTSGYRVVLTWGEDPSDLDSHLFTPEINGTRYHIYFSYKGDLLNPPYVNLDVDCVTSYGPETTTIVNTVPGDYYYSVHHYSGSGSLTTTSNATISLYGVDGFIRSWTVPSTGDGIWWNVFSFNGETGKITNINTISDDPPANYKGMAEMDMKNGK